MKKLKYFKKIIKRSLYGKSQKDLFQEISYAKQYKMDCLSLIGGRRK